jgi:hypothetical protein
MENSQKYNCDLCSFYASKKSDWNRHISTFKHKKIIDSNDKKNTKKTYSDNIELCKDSNIIDIINNNTEYVNSIELNPTKEKLDNKYNCEVCNKNYKSNNSLWYHRKKCKNIDKNETNFNISEPYNIITELLKQNNELQKQIIELCKEPKQVINNYSNTTSNNTNNNSTTNQSFNLNVFLNETCKDAMNVKEFLENLNPTMDDLENVGEKGFVKGISEIILKSLRGMEINKRPIHCTDIKREVVYLKEDDTWNKDDKNNTRMKELIRIVENKNFNNVLKWQRNHPDVMILDSPDYMKRNMLVEVSCEAVDKEDRVRGKVLKELLKEIHINREL